ncbi:MAG: hypothetical protein M3O22_00205 [Pseudomonadota bacterium]|nr:hypothetical protein [Pseudomonadota bacterium]
MAGWSGSGKKCEGDAMLEIAGGIILGFLGIVLIRKFWLLFVSLCITGGILAVFLAFVLACIFILPDLLKTVIGPKIASILVVLALSPLAIIILTIRDRLRERKNVNKETAYILQKDEIL